MFPWDIKMVFKNIKTILRVLILQCLDLKNKIKKVKHKNIFQFFSSQLAEKPAIDSVSKITIRVSHRVQKQLCESEREEEWGLSSAEAGSTALQRIKGEFLFSAES